MFFNIDESFTILSFTLTGETDHESEITLPMLGIDINNIDV